MTFDAYWQQLQDATPGLRRPEGTMRIGVLSSKAGPRENGDAYQARTCKRLHLRVSWRFRDYRKGSSDS